MASTVGGYELIKHGDFAFVDTGAPEGESAYTTLVLIHGFAWHSGAFAPLLPFAKSEKCRIILVNRTDYPASKVLGEEEVKLLAREQADAVDGFHTFFKHRANELVDFLAWLTQNKGIAKVTDSPSGGKSGGVILTTRSLANYLAVALLGHLGDLHAESVEALQPYMRCVQIYDAPYWAFGYPAHPEAYNPLSDIADPAEAARAMSIYGSAFWKHPDPEADSATQPKLEFRTWAPEPAPTMTTLSLQQVAAEVYPAAITPDKADTILFQAATSWNRPAFESIRRKAFEEKSLHGRWPGVGVRWVWCPMSTWECPWGAWNMRRDIAAAKEGGRFARDVTFFKVDGANHFYHWHEPEQALKIFLGAKL